MSVEPVPIHGHYDLGKETDRLAAGPGLLERERTRLLLIRHLPPPPAVVLDIGGGPGDYAAWLAELGYAVRLYDPMPLHVEEAAARLAGRGSAAVGDARSLPEPDVCADAVLLLGPLYHLPVRADRLQALREACRVLKPGGLLVVAAISRFASLMDGVFRDLIADPAFLPILAGDLADGQHRNPTNHPQYFTTAYFHRPEDLRGELAEAGLETRLLTGLEGPFWCLPDFERVWDDPARRALLMESLDKVGEEPSLLGASAHLLAIARRSE